MSKTKNKKQSTAPHSKFAMFFYRTFNKLFGVFKSKIEEQERYEVNKNKEQKHKKENKIEEPEHKKENKAKEPERHELNMDRMKTLEQTAILMEQNLWQTEFKN